MMKTVEEVFVVTSSGSGHLFPCIELCNHLSSRNYKTTLVLPSNLSSSLPPSFHHHPLLHTAEITSSSGGPPMLSSDSARHQMGLDLETHLRTALARPICAIIDFQMGWTKHVFWKFNIPIISFFTFSACAAAMEWGAWKSDAGKINAGEVLNIPDLPKEMTVTFTDLKGRVSRPSRAGGPSGSSGGGPPKPGDRPPWVPLIEGSIGLMFNTCDDLERPFTDYMANQMGMPVWGVGPLLPEKYWQSFDKLISDRQIRLPKHLGNHNEDEVIQWLGSKPCGSVLYVSFGSEVSPTSEEYSHLASALEEATHPFIWVIQSPKLYLGVDEKNEDYYFPHGMVEKVGNRGLIIRGWAPQLLILSHRSTGAFLSHCGWNSTVEAIGRGVPFLAWPIRGDQIYNAKLVVNYFKVGYMAMAEGQENSAKKDLILEGIEKLMSDEDVHKRALALRAKFRVGFPKSSSDALDAFRGVLSDHSNEPVILL